ncbi:MAG: 6-phosphofructokinase, partial [SAR324 cluster bacterium]|nr:6-phosphofructokinase [SAR324 cluster bacterium]
MKSGKIGIVVSGGPAPGINTVIWSAVLEASNRGVVTVGFLNGFRGASSLEPNSWTFLNPQSVAEIEAKGGSILGTSRFNPFHHNETKEAFIRTLQVHDVNKLIVIGGEGSAYLSHQVSQQYPNIQVVHVPKTIDNDLILPNDHPSFGFETARAVGTKVLKTL